MLIVFHSTVGTLAPRDANDTWDVFLADLRAGQIQLINRSPEGIQGSGQSLDPAISPNGNAVAFISSSPELIPGDTNEALDVLVHDRTTGALSRVSVSSDGEEADADSAGPPALSADGRLVAFESAASNLVPWDDNGMSDVFVFDRTTGKIERVSLPSAPDHGLGWFH
jgi:Tol biopolymer transport system component